ncbi:MAG TPA: glucosamine-6-phosphate deaminase, partial [Rubrobacter sp.]|nr:glucosamine-6-phosphate deaminase [Rubrobacter sp.]
MRARVFPDYEAISAAVAYVVAGRLEEEPSTVLMLPTGITPLGMYRRLVEMHRSGGLSFANATFFNLDEYLGLAPDHEASYHVYMKEHFYGQIDADPARVFVPDGTA